MNPFTAIGHPSRPLAVASEFDYDVLAEIYNNTRVDYIVPMPMNAVRMRQYVDAYDVALDSSFVALDGQGTPVGLGMLGIRGDRAWITRLGVLPNQRGRGLGQSLMDAMLEAAWSAGCVRIQLEVIAGNDPAHRLFVKNGFEYVRDLLVVRRPPRTGNTSPLSDPDTEITEIHPDELPDVLAGRSDTPSWLDETRSLLNWGNLRGLQAVDRHGGYTWVVYQPGPFQLTHFALGNYLDAGVTRALLFNIHAAHPRSDTKIENLPADSPHWPAMQSMGYIETFRRQEMVLWRP
jgi:GNAT superfamily N-acetyltransferase